MRMWDWEIIDFYPSEPSEDRGHWKATTTSGPRLPTGRPRRNTRAGATGLNSNAPAPSAETVTDCGCRQEEPDDEQDQRAFATRH